LPAQRWRSAADPLSCHAGELWDVCTTAKAVCWLIEVLRMSRLTPKIVRRRFFVAAGHALHLTWPVLSIILAFQVALGLLIGLHMVWHLCISKAAAAQG
jgi:hypothetical protein